MGRKSEGISILVKLQRTLEKTKLGICETIDTKTLVEGALPPKEQKRVRSQLEGLVFGI